MQHTKTGVFKIFNAARYCVGVVVAQFNRDITDKLLASCLAKLSDYRVPKKNITVCRVPGSIELPVVLQALAKRKRYDCLVALGAVIRGATDHYDFVIKLACEGISRVSLDYKVPIGFGLLTCKNKTQARARLAAGGLAAEAALQAARVVREIK